MEWRRPDGTFDVDRFLAHACSVLGDPAERVGLDLDAVRGAIIERPAWHDEAACRGQGTRLFFAPQGASSAPARAVCADCHVTAECLAAAVSGHEVGIWAGSTADQRRLMRRAARGAA